MKGVLSDMIQNSSLIIQNWWDPWQFRNIAKIVAPLWGPRQGHVYIKSSAPMTFFFSLSPFSISQQQTNISSKTQQL